MALYPSACGSGDFTTPFSTLHSPRAPHSRPPLQHPSPPHPYRAAQSHAIPQTDPTTHRDALTAGMLSPNSRADHRVLARTRRSASPLPPTLLHRTRALHSHTHLAAAAASRSAPGSCVSKWHISTSLSASSSACAVDGPAVRSSDASASPPKSRSALEPAHCARS
eukprot:scaffold25392_cov72-Phaeocystis_antarctica.AAC.8